MNTDDSRWDSGPAETTAENGSWRVKENLKGRLFIRGVSSHSNARDIKYHGKQRGCSVVKRSGESGVWAYLHLGYFPCNGRKSVQQSTLQHKLLWFITASPWYTIYRLHWNFHPKADGEWTETILRRDSVKTPGGPQMPRWLTNTLHKWTSFEWALLAAASVHTY